jgi:hypothetical protein
VDKFKKFRLSGEKSFGKVSGAVQAEGGFGSRQSDVGCLDSVIEVGIQSTRRRQKQLGLHLNVHQASIFEQPKVVFFIPQVIRQHYFLLSIGRTSDAIPGWAWLNMPAANIIYPSQRRDWGAGPSRQCASAAAFRFFASSITFSAASRGISS